MVIAKLRSGESVQIYPRASCGGDVHPPQGVGCRGCLSAGEMASGTVTSASPCGRGPGPVGVRTSELTLLWLPSSSPSCLLSAGLFLMGCQEPPTREEEKLLGRKLT